MASWKTSRLPVMGVCWLITFFLARAADELERRIQGEALAIAYPLVLVIARRRYT